MVTSLKQARHKDWLIDSATGNALAQQPSRNQAEIEICARCHSRRAQLFGDYHYGALLDSHLPSLLTEPLYHADGQIDGEVYEYGSFLQSKMYHAGVSCSDCHESHSLKPRQSGNGLCGQCHSAAKYDSAQHHFHPVGKAGAFCVDCHMPSKTYMGVDARRDHGFRVPRPDQSERLGAPNACHTDKTAQWAAQRLRAWYGRVGKGYQHYAEALHAARTHKTDAGDRLIALLQDSNQPAIARATAVAALPAQKAYRAALALDPKWLPAYINWADHLRVNNRDDEGGAILQQGLRQLPDAAALHHSLGLLAMRQQNIEKALDSLSLAVRLQPDDARFSYVYAAVLANVGRLDEARTVLKTALTITPNDAELQALQAELGPL